MLRCLDAPPKSWNLHQRNLLQSVMRIDVLSSEPRQLKCFFVNTGTSHPTPNSVLLLFSSVDG